MNLCGSVLKGFNLGDEGGKAIADALKVNNTLQKLNIDNNTNFFINPPFDCCFFHTHK